MRNVGRIDQLLRRLPRPPRRVRVLPAHEVTSIGNNEVDPEEVGLVRADVEAIWATVLNYYKTGLQPAINLCMHRYGKVFLNRAIGHIHGNTPGTTQDIANWTRATPDSVFNFFSGSKAVTAMLAHLCVERGNLKLDEPIAAIIPAFGKHGKHSITLRHVLNHTAGFPTLPQETADLELLSKPEAILDVLCEARPETVAGRQLAYHALAGGFLIAELIKQVTGQTISEFLDAEIRKPLGFTTFQYGVKPGTEKNVADNVFTGLKPRYPISRQLRKALGYDNMDNLIAFANDPRFLASVIPSGNLFATAGEIALFFDLLLQEGERDGVRLFKPETVARARNPQSFAQFDHTLLMPMRYGLGFMLGRDRFSLFGPQTPGAFGHLGFTTVLGWADTERSISVALLNSGKPLLNPDMTAWLHIMRTISRRIPRGCA